MRLRLWPHVPSLLQVKHVDPRVPCAFAGPPPGCMPRPCCLPAPLTDGCRGSEWHERGEAPVDPIVLIKTRYSAFAYCLPEYIRATTSESGPEFDPRTEEWDAKLVDFCKTYSFRKLSGDVLGVSIEECRFWSPLRSNVLFKARMMSDDNKLIEFWERAVLTRESEDKGWKYHKGNLLEYTGPLY